jgi:hypothetical protein
LVVAVGVNGRKLGAGQTGPFAADIYVSELLLVFTETAEV